MPPPTGSSFLPNWQKDEPRVRAKKVSQCNEGVGARAGRIDKRKREDDHVVAAGPRALPFCPG